MYDEQPLFINSPLHLIMAAGPSTVLLCLDLSHVTWCCPLLPVLMFLLLTMMMMIRVLRGRLVFGNLIIQVNLIGWGIVRCIDKPLIK